MRHLIIIFLMSISAPMVAQNWAAIGMFNRGLVTFFEDTVSDELFIGGNFNYFNSDTLASIAKWDGISMTTLGCGLDWDCVTTGISGYSPPVNQIIRFNGNIYATGGFEYASGKIVNGLAEWDGYEWNNFETGLKLTNGSTGLGLGLKIIDNELYVYGVFDSVGGVPFNSIAKWDGTTWSTVHDFPKISSLPGNINWITDIAVYNNELYVCGNFHNLPLGTIFNIVKWDGTEWIGVGGGVSGGTVQLNKMLIFNNELIVAGRFSKTDNPENPGENIAKWNGTQWSEMGGGVDGAIRDIKVHDNNLYACGYFQHAGGISSDKIAKWDGSKWCGFGTSIDNVVNAIEFYHDTLYIGGGFWTINGDSMGYISKWLGGNYIDTCGSMSGTGQEQNDASGFILYPNPFHNASTLKLNTELKSGTLLIYDFIGKEMFRYENINSSEINVSREGLDNGMYFYKVIDGNGTIGQGKMVVN